MIQFKGELFHGQFKHYAKQTGRFSKPLADEANRHKASINSARPTHPQPTKPLNTQHLLLLEDNDNNYVITQPLQLEILLSRLLTEKTKADK